MRCDKPKPVLPAMNAGTQPPLGVIDTTQPSASAACIDVVPAMNAWSCVISYGASFEAERRRSEMRGCQFSSTSRNGFVAPWNGYGSPGRTNASFCSQLISAKRLREYSFESNPLIGSTGGTYGSP